MNRMSLFLTITIAFILPFIARPKFYLLETDDKSFGKSTDTSDEKVRTEISKMGNTEIDTIATHVTALQDQFYPFWFKRTENSDGDLYKMPYVGNLVSYPFWNPATVNHGGLQTSHNETGSFYLHGGSWGTWGTIDKCSFPSFVTGIELKIEQAVGSNFDDSALNAIRLTCSDGRRITSSQGPWGNWIGIWTCLEGHINSAQIRREENKGICKEEGCDDTAANGVRVLCTDGRYGRPGDGYWGTWTNFQSCESGSAIIGIQTQVEPVQGNGDDTALNDVRFFCARIPPQSGFGNSEAIEKENSDGDLYKMPYVGNLVSYPFWNPATVNLGGLQTSHSETGSFYLHGGSWGTWGTIDKCSFPSFVTGIELKIEQKVGSNFDDSALNAIRLTCSDGRRITSLQGPWGNWIGIWTCLEGYINSAQIRREEYQGTCKKEGCDDTAANGVRVLCTDGRYGRPGDGYWGTWTNFQSCESGSAIIGIQTQVEPGQGNGDDTALNDVRFFCARIPPRSGFGNWRW